MLNKVLTWFLGFTKLGKVVEPVQAFLDGKKAYFAGLGIAIPAVLAMLQKFSEQGIGYFTGITTTPEYLALMNGLAIMGVRAAIAKTQ